MSVCFKCVRVFPLLRERKTLAKCFEEFCFFFLSPSSLLKNLGFVSFLNFSFRVFDLFLLALKVCLQNLFCCAVVGRGEREEKDRGRKNFEALLTFFSLLKEC